MEVLAVVSGYLQASADEVLILILMEVLAVFKIEYHSESRKGLNPYSNGSIGGTHTDDTYVSHNCLNPYSNGSIGGLKTRRIKNTMNSRLNPYSNGSIGGLKEEGQRTTTSLKSLNPYSNGSIGGKPKNLLPTVTKPS